MLRPFQSDACPIFSWLPWAPRVPSAILVDPIESRRCNLVRYSRFADFYPFYLSEHKDRTCRRLHFVGTTLGLVFLVWAVATRNPWWVLAGLLCGYALAWTGHFFFERNRPATFEHPLYSLFGDWVMWAQILTGRIPF